MGITLLIIEHAPGPCSVSILWHNLLGHLIIKFQHATHLIKLNWEKTKLQIRLEGYVISVVSPYNYWRNAFHVTVIAVMMQV